MLVCLNYICIVPFRVLCVMFFSFSFVVPCRAVSCRFVSCCLCVNVNACVLKLYQYCSVSFRVLCGMFFSFSFVVSCRLVSFISCFVIRSLSCISSFHLFFFYGPVGRGMFDLTVITWTIEPRGFNPPRKKGRPVLESI